MEDLHVFLFPVNIQLLYVMTIYTHTSAEFPNITLNVLVDLYWSYPLAVPTELGICNFDDSNELYIQEILNSKRKQNCMSSLVFFFMP